MNKSGLILILSVVLLGAQLYAADEPKVELFGGYQYTRIGGAEGVNANGWNGAITGYMNDWFGLEADFSGAYKSFGGANLNAHTYTFGPVFAAAGDRAKPFAHALFGGFHASAGFQGEGASVNGFAMMLGGGVDIKASDHISVRAVQADWILWRAEGVTEKTNGRVSAGLVFRF